MSFEKAQQLVMRMRDDTEFRSDLVSKPDSETMKKHLRESGYNCSRRELVCAMAGCMEELEKTMKGAS